MIGLALVCLSAAATLVLSSCPRLALQKVTSCTADLGIDIITGSSRGEAVGQSDTDRLARACENGALLNAIKCVENVMDECRGSHSEQAALLRKVIDPQRVGRSLDFLCANLQAYTVNRKCIADHHDDQVACTGHAMSHYHTGASRADGMDAMVRAQCTFYHAMEECAQSVLRKQCSRDAAKIVTAVLEGFRPPSCGAAVKRGGVGDRRQALSNDDEVASTDEKQTSDEEERGVSVGERQAIDEKRGVSIDERQAIDEKRGVLKDERQVIDEKRGVLTNERQAIDEKMGVSTDERQAIDEKRGVSTVERQVIDEKRGVSIDERQAIDEKRGVLKDERQAIDEKSGVTVVIRQAVDDRAGSKASQSMSRGHFNVHWIVSLAVTVLFIR